MSTIWEVDNTALMYKGGWNATTNSPTLGDNGAGGVQNDFYVVTTAGTTSLDGNASWNVGDWAINNGSVWGRVPAVSAAANHAHTGADGTVKLAATASTTISATNKILGRVTAGAGSTEEITCTAAGRAILDDADAAAQRTTIGAVGLTGDENVAGIKTFTKVVYALQENDTSPGFQASNGAGGDLTITCDASGGCDIESTGGYIFTQGTIEGLDLKADNEVFAVSSRMTQDGGFAVVMTAGETLSGGDVVYSRVAGGADGKVWKNPIDGDMPIGVIYLPHGTASADAAVYVVVAGIATVKPNAADTAVRGYVIYSSSTTAGRVDQSASVPAATTHFREVGHWIATGSGAGIATKAIVHFN